MSRAHALLTLDDGRQVEIQYKRSTNAEDRTHLTWVLFSRDGEWQELHSDEWLHRYPTRSELRAAIKQTGA